MNHPKLINIEFPAVDGFNFMIKRSKLTKKSHTHEIDLHTHKQLELYINLSGDISFLVENTLYPVSYGDIIIARPGEYHHCVYNSEEEHNFFWILIDTYKNPELFNFFINQTTVNLISPTKKAKDEIINLCKKMLYDDLPSFDRFYCFFRFFNILKESADNSSVDLNTMPRDLVKILKFIDNHISENIRVSDIACALYLSESTVERRFKQYLRIKPLEFIQKKKMLLAAQLLLDGESVLSAGLSVGYSDNSYFINIFKRFYGVTPAEYKKNALK